MPEDKRSDEEKLTDALKKVDKVKPKEGIKRILRETQGKTKPKGGGKR